MSADIKGAYLIPDVGDKDEDIQFVWIDPTIIQYLVALPRQLRHTSTRKAESSCAYENTSMDYHKQHITSIRT